MKEPGMSFFCYIMSSKSRTLYCGVTNDLTRRVAEHRSGKGSTFTRRYRCHRLVWFQQFDHAWDAIAAEKRIKGWARAKKVALIESINPDWDDLAASS
jgi:putative endonuclease